MCTDVVELSKTYIEGNVQSYITRIGLENISLVSPYQELINVRNTALLEFSLLVGVFLFLVLRDKVKV